MEDLPENFESQELPSIETENFRVDTPSPLMEYDLKQTVSADHMSLEEKLDILKFVKEHDSAYIRGTFGKNSETGEIEWVTIDAMYYTGKLSRENLLDFLELTQGMFDTEVTERVDSEQYCSLAVSFDR